MTKAPDYDVAIIGGGPGGSVTAGFLKKYNPALKVVVLEREVFPRDHIGESLLPPICRVLDELDAWDKVEAKRFPIKLGATYTWGKTTEPWVFGFIPPDEIGDETRPGKYEGWRTRVAWQVDRSIFDTVLLDHAASLGAEVRQGAKVVKVHHEAGKGGKAVTGLELENGQRVTARYYVDASGNAAVIRRQLGVAVDAPTLLRNIAFWDYWTKPGLNKALLEEKTIRILIRSLGYGWIWYIALGEDRTSVGLVCNAEYYKKTGKRPEEIYREALAGERQISGLLAGATPRNKIDSTTDWSYVAEKAYGPNWFLCGECLGFADPILSAGLTLTHTCAQHLAATILELDRGELEASWLKSQYEAIQRRRVLQHIKFADYWYSGNGLFENIVENCAAIAEQSGIKLAPADAFRWISFGGVDDLVGQFAIGGLGMSGVKSVQQRFKHGTSGNVTYMIDKGTGFNLNLRGAERTMMAAPAFGRVLKLPVLERGESRVPLAGPYAMVVEALKQVSAADALVGALQAGALKQAGGDRSAARSLVAQCMQCLEALATQGWVTVEKAPGKPAIQMSTPEEGDIVYTEKLGPRTKRTTA